MSDKIISYHLLDFNISTNSAIELLPFGEELASKTDKRPNEIIVGLFAANERNLQQVKMFVEK